MSSSHWPAGSKVRINDYGLRWWHTGGWEYGELKKQVFVVRGPDNVHGQPWIPSPFGNHGLDAEKIGLDLVFAVKREIVKISLP